MINEQDQGVQIKGLAEKILALLLLVASIPLFVIVWVAIKLEDGGSLLFRQKRWGKGKKPFTLIKFRTMVKGAEGKKRQLLLLNEADDPVFKIRNDPRYTKVGKLLAHTGLDELPQLVNVVKGEMSFVGPRPLPIDEAKKIPKKYAKRFLVTPGITSSWVVEGAHELSFGEWMKLDLDYVDNESRSQDLIISLKTIRLIVVSFLKEIGLIFNKGKK